MRNDDAVIGELRFLEITVEGVHEVAHTVEYVCTRFTTIETIVEMSEFITVLFGILVIAIHRKATLPFLFPQPRVFVEILKEIRTVDLIPSLADFVIGIPSPPKWRNGEM